MKQIPPQIWTIIWTILAIAALVGSTALAIRAMDEQQAAFALSTVTVTVQTDDGSAFKLNGRVILPDAAIPDTVIVEIWKNGKRSTYCLAAVRDSVGERLIRLQPGNRALAK